jgi:hypothetical protein
MSGSNVRAVVARGTVCFAMATAAGLVSAQSAAASGVQIGRSAPTVNSGIYSLTGGGGSIVASVGGSGTTGSNVSSNSSPPTSGAGGSYLGPPIRGIDSSLSADASGLHDSYNAGGLVWGEPLSKDIVDFGPVHTRLRYFSQIGGNGTEQAVGLNFSIRY